MKKETTLSGVVFFWSVTMGYLCEKYLMFIYNVTVAIDTEFEANWLKWMQETHLPEMLQTGCFTDAAMHKVLHSAHETGHTSYAIQYRLNSYKDLENYYHQHAHFLRDKAFKAFGDKFIAIRTELEEIYMLKKQDV